MVPTPRDAAAQAQRGPTYVLRLYVTGTTPRSQRAVGNLRRLLDQHLAGRYSLEVVDLYQHAEAAREEQIIAAPTLVKELPRPLRKVIGDLSDTDKVLLVLSVDEVRGP